MIETGNIKKSPRTILSGGVEVYGADDGIRTRDPDLGKVVLYQLSHVRMGNTLQFSNPSLRKEAMEATPGFEPGMKALQASALPLGHVATVQAVIKRPAKKQAPDRPCNDNGADDGIRTRDPDLGKVVLYQLSHVRIARRYDTGTSYVAQAFSHIFSNLSFQPPKCHRINPSPSGACCGSLHAHHGLAADCARTLRRSGFWAWPQVLWRVVPRPQCCRNPRW